MSAPSSTFFARDTLRFNIGSYQTVNRRRGSRLIVRADAVSHAFLGNNDFLSGFRVQGVLVKLFLFEVI